MLRFPEQFTCGGADTGLAFLTEHFGVTDRLLLPEDREGLDPECVRRWAVRVPVWEILRLVPARPEWAAAAVRAAAVREEVPLVPAPVAGVPSAVPVLEGAGPEWAAAVVRAAEARDAGNSKNGCGGLTINQAPAVFI